MMGSRRTIVVHTKFAGHMARVEAARAGASGLQILTMGQLAGRLAGGFIQPIDPEASKDAIREVVANTNLGELEPIKNLPGMVRAAVSTLDKIWGANIDLSGREHACLQALGILEEEVLRRLPPSMKRPKDMVALAHGSASAPSLSRPAQASLTLRPVGLLDRHGGLCHEASASAGCPTRPLVSYQSYRQLSGWNLPPLVTRAVGAHCMYGLGAIRRALARRARDEHARLV